MHSQLSLVQLIKLIFATHTSASYISRR